MKNKRILVIEDEFLVALEITSVLEEAGFGEVQQAATEKTALEQIEEGTWDAVVADANLNGRRIDRIAGVLTQKGIPFVVVTGYERKSLLAAIGAAPILEKPFRGPQLVQTLSRLCGV